MDALSYFHRGGKAPLVCDTIGGRFDAIVKKYAQNDAVVCNHERLTYLAFSEKVDDVARSLLGLGFQRGDRIGIWSTNNLTWMIVQMATAKIGAILVNINPSYRKEELAYALKQSQLQGLFCIAGFRDHDYFGTLSKMIPELDNAHQGAVASIDFPDLRYVIAIEEAGTMARPLGFLSWDRFLSAAKRVTSTQLRLQSQFLDCDDAINIQYTSGTTGFPKAVVLTHHNILNNALAAATSLDFDDKDRLCIPVPFYHCFGMVLSNLMALSVGACAIVPGPFFNARQVLKAVSEERCTALHGVPTMFVALLDCEAFEAYDCRSLRTGIMAGAPCPPSLMKRVIADLHMRELLIGYGQTEASPLTHLTDRNDSFDKRINSVGKNLPHQEVKIVDPEIGHKVALGDVGEICFRGYHVMRGYYQNSDATAKAIDQNGWLHSGDLGSMDTQGYVCITGRLKDMIIRGGENIYPKEIENVLFEHPAVAQVAVFGIADEYYGESVATWIQLHPDMQCSIEEITRFCRERLASFKVPRRIRFVDQFPTTVTGKVQKFRMRETEENRASCKK